MPSYLPGVFVVLAGLAMIVGRKPLSLLQYAALKQARVAGANRDRTLAPLRRIIIGGSILFIGFGVFLAVNPLMR